MNEVKILFSQENDKVVLPTKRVDDAGFDLYADPEFIGECITIDPLQTIAIPTGLRSVMPNTHYAQVQERGSTGIRGIKYGAGVIDASYRGIWNVVITNCNQSPIVIYNPQLITEEDIKRKSYTKVETYPITKGIAQFVVLPVPQVKIELVSQEEVMNCTSNRMEGKFGSSGK